jgi:hypothetical protein
MRGGIVMAKTEMEWKQNGEIHRCGDYTIVEHNQDGKRRYSLEYGDRYVREGNYATLSDAKRAASEHADKGSLLNELQSEDRSSSDAPNGAMTRYYLVVDNNDKEIITKYDDFATAKRAYDKDVELLKTKLRHVALWSNDGNGDRCLFHAE